MRKLLVTLFAVPGLVSGTLIVDDPFTDGGVSDGADPLDTAWSSGSAGGTLSVVDDAAGIGTGNALQRGADSNFEIVRGNAVATLAGVGTSISLNFDFRVVNAPASVNNGFRLGVGNAGNAYVGAMNLGTSPGGTIFYNPNGSTGGAGQVGFAGQTGSNPAIGDTLAHTASLSLVRTVSGIDASFSVDGTAPRTGSFASTQAGFFEDITRIYIGFGSTNNDFRIDNVRLDNTVIPEPGSLALMLLGSGLLLRWRKCRIT